MLDNLATEILLQIIDYLSDVKDVVRVCAINKKMNFFFKNCQHIRLPEVCFYDLPLVPQFMTEDGRELTSINDYFTSKDQILVDFDFDLRHRYLFYMIKSLTIRNYAVNTQFSYLSKYPRLNVTCLKAYPNLKKIYCYHITPKYYPPTIEHAEVTYSVDSDYRQFKSLKILHLHYATRNAFPEINPHIIEVLEFSASMFSLPDFKQMTKLRDLTINNMERNTILSLPNTLISFKNYYGAFELPQSIRNLHYFVPQGSFLEIYPITHLNLFSLVLDIGSNDIIDIRNVNVIHLTINITAFLLHSGSVFHFPNARRVTIVINHIVKNLGSYIGKFLKQYKELDFLSIICLKKTYTYNVKLPRLKIKYFGDMIGVNLKVRNDFSIKN